MHRKRGGPAVSDEVPFVALSSRSIAERTSAELHLLAAHVQKVERAIVELLQREDLALRSATIKELQKLDTISQSLSALTAYLDSAAPGMWAEDAVDTRLPLSRVPLRALAERLAGGGGGRAAKDMPETGVCTVF